MFNLPACEDAWQRRREIPSASGAMRRSDMAPRMPPPEHREDLSVQPPMPPAPPPKALADLETGELPTHAQLVAACRSLLPDAFDALKSGLDYYRARMAAGKFDLPAWKQVGVVFQLLTERAFGAAPEALLVQVQGSAGAAVAAGVPAFLASRTPEQLDMLMAGLADPPRLPAVVTSTAVMVSPEPPPAPSHVPPAPPAPPAPTTVPEADLKAGW